jgi:glyoxylase-like metal-dependent hydrolase (beta-lactamase superfamily II)
MKTWMTQNGYLVLRILSGRCNAFAVLHGSRFILVDTGRRIRRGCLMKAVDGLCAAGNTFAALVLTHAHFDHVENAAEVAERYCVPVIIEKEEIEYLADGRNAPIRNVMGLPRLASRFVHKGMGRWFRYAPVQGAIPMESAVLRGIAGMEGLTALATPGHTPGSASVVVDGEIAIVGDTMHGVFPGNARPPFACDEAALLQSWRKLMETGCRNFLPAHGGWRSNETVRKQIAGWTKRSGYTDG